MFKAMYNTGSPLVVGFLLFVLTMPTLRAQEHTVGLLMGYGRSYQVGTPGGSIDERYMGFKSSSNFMIGGWYERQFADSRFSFWGGLSYGNRGYWMSQDQFANDWFRSAEFKVKPNYEVFSGFGTLNYNLFPDKKLNLDVFVGASASWIGLKSFTISEMYENTNVVPLYYKMLVNYNFTEKDFGTIEPILGFRADFNSQRKLLSRLSYWCMVSVPTRGLDRISYNLTNTFEDETVSYQANWRSRMANWTIGISYNLFSWGLSS